MNVQWYPGHMTRARRQMTEDMKLIDLVIELIDARIPFSSRNPDIDDIARGKSRILLLNKADLADPVCNEKWQDYYASEGYLTALLNSQKGEGLRRIQPLIDEACAEKRERDRKRGIINRPVRAMICGIPNVGKSTFINALAGKAAAKTGNKPGVTRGKQWIRISRGVELLDTPGLLWPKFDDPHVGICLALAGSVKDEVVNTEELSGYLISTLQEYYPDSLRQRYASDKIHTAQTDAAYPDAASSSPAVLQMIANARGCLLKDGEADTRRAADLLIDDFRKGRLGRISLEWP